MKLLILIIGLFATSFSFAQVTPISNGFDYRIVSVQYNPFNVILVRTKVGVSTLIQLEEGETIISSNSGVGMGDALAWGFNVRGNNIFFKPKAKKPDTNLTVVSDFGRTYSFELVSDKKPHYVVHIDYTKPKTAGDYKNNLFPCSDKNLNFQYLKWGDESLAPHFMWDDGRFTCLKFSENLELPVVYKISSDGVESLVNYHMEEDTMVLHDIANEFRARLGDRVLGLKSDLIRYAGHNTKASTINAKRGIKEL